MRKIILFALFTLTTLSAKAHSQEEQVNINVAGIDLTISPSGPFSRVHTFSRYAKYRSHLALFELGFNIPTNVSYGTYNGTVEPWFNLIDAKSTQFTFNVFSVGTRLSPNGTVGLSAALGITWSNYVFETPTRVKRTDGMLTAEPVDTKGWVKSKINTFALHLPILLEVGQRKGFFAAVGGYGDLVVGSRSKIKYSKHNKEINRGLNLPLLQAGVTARVGYRRVYMFGNYSLTELFRNEGPSTNILTIGLGIGF